eukprot:TRINITY_DN5822_c0_g1_i1.p1 TRINITY_DN5822_c0_g1~~TRINITY_DN5822_c0_g1_i1.p1  ORF type:complete len:494 (+),score=56.42 TRINITY_DN5822_c0_g1_i1:77-1558(+)
MERLEIGEENTRKVRIRSKSESSIASAFREWSSEGITFMQAYLSLVTCIIGAGIMCLPGLPKRGGLVPSSIMMAVCAYVIALSGCDGVCSTFTAYNKNRAEDEKMQAFDDLGKKAMGKAGLMIVTATQSTFIIGLLAGYLILVSEQLEGMFSRQLSAHTWKSILFLPLCALSCLRDMTAVAKLIPLAVTAAYASCLLICVKAMLDAPAWDTWETTEHGFLLGSNNTSLNVTLFQMWPTSGMALGSVIGIIYGAYSVNHSVPSIMSEMRDPSQMPRALRAALATCLILYLFIMLMGHYGYGNFVQDNLLDSMTRAPASAEEAFTKPWCWWTGRCGNQIALMMQICVLVNLVISFPLMLMAVVQSVQSIEGARDYVPTGSVANYVMRIVMMTIVFAIGFTIDKFGLVFGLFSSLCGPMLQTIYPITFGYMIEKSLGEPARLTPGKIFSLAIAAFCVVVGFADSLNELTNNWGAVNECLGVEGYCAGDGERFVHAM